MKIIRPTLLLLVLNTLLSPLLLAQTADNAKALINQGVELNDAGKYDEAVEKYKEALKIDPNNLQADYEIGFTLYNSGKGKDAIPYLEKIMSSDASKYEADDLLGSIYDDLNEPDKAIEYYKNGIKEKPDFEHLHFNLGISYLRQGKFADAEACEVAAIKLDQKHASSQRIYALAAYGGAKKMRSLLAWCSFLLLEPNTKRSAEAFGNVQKILNYGITKQKDNSITITVNDHDLGNEDLLLPTAVVTATSDKTNLTPIDSLTLQLTSVFEVAGEYKKADKEDFYTNFYAAFFYKLVKSDNMPTFIRLISLSAYKDENLAWFKEHKVQLDALDLWIRSTPRTF